MENNETIAAIATGLTNAGISVIRISGSKAFSIGNMIFKSEKNVDFMTSPGYRAYFGWIVYENKRIDEAVVLVMRGPHSYTGEDTLEISCHGGVLITKKILEIVIKSGARPAMPGEFTKRAFLNGKMDLAEAEAVIDIIDAENDYAIKASAQQLSGRLSTKIRQIREELLNSISYIEAALDDPEHIELDEFSIELVPKIRRMREDIKEISDTFDEGRALSVGIRTVILGKPNAGKSSLLNLFYGDERAIVTDVAGTTRDVLSEKISIEGISFIMVDTAGIHDSEDIVERIGIERSLEQAKQSDLILFVVDSSRELDKDDRRILDFIKDRKFIVVYNKTDLKTVTTKEMIEEILGKCCICAISAKNATAFDELKKMMVSMFTSGSFGMNNQIIITNMRHRDALMRAIKSLSNVIDCIDCGFSEDMWTIDMTDAYSELGEIIGEAVDEDVINRIFEKFCMGK